MANLIYDASPALPVVKTNLSAIPIGGLAANYVLDSDMNTLRQLAVDAAGAIKGGQYFGLANNASPTLSITGGANLAAQGNKLAASVNGLAYVSVDVQALAQQSVGLFSALPSATLTPDITKGQIHFATLDTNGTVANPVNAGGAASTGSVVRFGFVQDATGYRTLIWGTSYKGVSRFMPRQGPGQVSRVDFVWNGDGTLTLSGFDGIDQTRAFDPMDFGAVGTGFVDDQPAIQATLNYAASRTPDPSLQWTPNWVELPQGEFALSKPLKMPAASMRLTGKGMNATLLSAFADRTGQADWGGPMIVHSQETVKLARAGLNLGTNLLTGAGNSMVLDPTLSVSNMVFLALTHDAPAALDMNYHTRSGSAGSDLAIEFAMWIDPADGAVVGNPVYVLASLGQPRPGNDFVTNMFRITMNRQNSTQYSLAATLQLDTGLATVTCPTLLTFSTIYRVCLQFTQATNAVTLFLEGVGTTATVAATSHPVQHPFESIQVGDRICSKYPYGDTDTQSFKGRIDGIRISCVSRYAANYTPSAAKPTFDGNTNILLNFDTFYGQMPVAIGNLAGYGGQTRLYLPPRGPGITNNDFYGRAEIKDLGLFGRASTTGIMFTSSVESRIENVEIRACYRGIEFYENSFIGEVRNVHVEMASQAGGDSHSVAAKEAFLFYGANGYLSFQDCYAIGGSVGLSVGRPGITVDNFDHAIGQDVVYSLMFYHADEFDVVQVRGYGFDLEGVSPNFKACVLLYAIRTATFENCTLMANGTVGLPDVIRIQAGVGSPNDTLSLINCVGLPTAGATVINVISGTPSIVCDNYKTLYGTAHTFTNLPRAVVTLGGEALPGVVTAAQVISNARSAVTDANYTATITDHRIAYTSLTAARTVTLPIASSVPTGQRVVLKDESGACSGTFTLTVSVAAAGTIDGAASKVITTPYGSLRLYSNGTQWMTE